LLYDQTAVAGAQIPIPVELEHSRLVTNFSRTVQLSFNEVAQAPTQVELVPKKEGL
jgi:hypothetical protein